MRVSTLVLDTSAYSHFRRGHKETLDWMSRAESIVIPTTVLGELHAGFHLGGRLADNQRVLEDFLNEPFTVVADVGPAEAQRYGKFFSELKRAGTPIPTNDVWIAATTVTRGGRLLTFDEDFSRIAALDMILLSA
ncbi:MAG TPA: type II toxin-antitoxin system VapC family toxin [Polyangiaceae bacterium]|nr:type II toxin-antitoxin system VapC family toxin [Polyangiaceae bacterium]HMR73916.1 type II toxin-antitoxin system VapC family toxin [Polyangiaceae bacterium]